MRGAPFGGRVSLPYRGRLGRRDPKGAAHDVDAAGVLNEQQPGYSDENAEQKGAERPHGGATSNIRVGTGLRPLD
jgi:hypothetical protein